MPPAAHRRGDPRGARRRGGLAPENPHREMREGLRLEHIAVETVFLDLHHRAVERGDEHLHHHGVAPPAAADEDMGRGRRAMFHPPRDRGRDDGGQRGSGLGVGQLRDRPGEPGERVPVERLGRHLEEVGMFEELREHVLDDLALRCEPPVDVAHEAEARAHEVVERRIAGSGVEGHERAGRLGRRRLRIGPGEVRDPADVEECDRVARADQPGQRPVIERRERRPLPAQPHVGGAEVPHDRHAQRIGQHLPVAHLQRARLIGGMGQRLTVEADHVDFREFGQKLGMGGLHDGRGGLHRLAVPLPERGAQHLALLRRIRAVGRFREGVDLVAVGHDDGGVHPVERGARHRPQGSDRPLDFHALPLRPSRRYRSPRPVRAENTRVAMTYHPKSDFLHVMIERGFMADCTDLQGLDEAMIAGVVPAYIGYDATAKSLHVGHLLNIMMLRWLQKTGHKPITLMGGGTTKVGDPSGRDTERSLITPAEIDANIAGLKGVFAQLLTFGEGPTDALMLDNAEWLDGLKYLDFLRDIGRHFSINRMLSFESVKSRLDREQSLSFLEFNYMILQAYDFLELHRRYGCRLQMGGSDQWGNIVNGIDLTRRVLDHEIYGLTSPLLTTSDGRKMGKSASGAIWLNSELLSPYEFWQFWRNTTDADVGRFLKLYTELPVEDCDRLGALAGSEINEAKIVLANEVTALCHGADAAAAAEATAREVFEKGGVGDDLPTVALTRDEIGNGISIVQLIVKAGLAKSGKEAKRLIAESGARIDDAPLTDPGMTIDASALSSPIKLSAGKKRHALVKLDL